MTNVWWDHLLRRHDLPVEIAEILKKNQAHLSHLSLTEMQQVVNFLLKGEGESQVDQIVSKLDGIAALTSVMAKVADLQKKENIRKAALRQVGKELGEWGLKTLLALLIAV
jgi:hypothetical protein